MILPLEEQVTRLKFSKELKKIGIPEDTYFCWAGWENPLNKIFSENDMKETDWKLMTKKEASKGGADWIYPAYNLSELFLIFCKDNWPSISIFNKKVQVFTDDHKGCDVIQYADTLIEALCKTIIDLDARKRYEGQNGI